MRKIRHNQTATMAATVAAEETVSIVSNTEEINFEYKYSFETTSDFLENEKDEIWNGPTNYNKKYGIPTVAELNQFTKTTATFLKWIEAEHPDILKIPNVCPRCSSKKLKINRRNVRCYACAHKGKEFKQSVWCETFFEGAKDPHKVMIFLYYWLTGASNKQIGIYTGWSKKTVQKWLTKVQELITEIVVHDDQLIGGPGIVVGIDESKFGKRKFNRRHKVDGSWVFGGVELTPERRFFAVVVPD